MVSVSEVEYYKQSQDGVFRQYRGARDKDSFISFVEEKKWQVDVKSPLCFIFIYQTNITFFQGSGTDL